MSLIVFDNRTCGYDRFEAEASTSAYLSNAADWVIKFYFMYRGASRSLPGPVHLALAKSVSSADVFEMLLNPFVLKKLLTDVMSCDCSARDLALGTFSIIRDAITKVLHMTLYKEGSTSRPVRVIVITTDINIFRLGNSDLLAEVQLLSDLMSAYAKRTIQIHLMCTLATEVTTAHISAAYREKALGRARRVFSSLPGTFSFSVFPNNPMYFNAEMTAWFASAIRPIGVVVLLPSSGSMKASVTVEARGADLHSHEWMNSFADMRQLTVQSRVPRTGINPLHIKGVNMIVSTPEEDVSRPQEQVRENKQLYTSLHSVLAASDSLFILSGYSEATGCIHTFALIPKDPADQKVTHMALLLLTDRDTLLYQYPYDEIRSTPAQPLDEDSEEFLKDSLQLCSLEPHYNPMIHPNNLLDYKKREIVEKCLPAGTRKLQTKREKNGGIVPESTNNQTENSKPRINQKSIKAPADTTDHHSGRSKGAESGGMTRGQEGIARGQPLTITEHSQYHTRTKSANTTKSGDKKKVQFRTPAKTSISRYSVRSPPPMQEYSSRRLQDDADDTLETVELY